ncbi:nuclear transport factor 2 family protein [Nocardia brasiliensis]|uniref:Nuclear transport factor 2 family protein n=1 Tax=Nocardia brasiliensis TaxID=37326 RepID=A0A6G9XTT5_NOCBR|nr:nuclear transport factor 2 family protein [Nocardia brasiliensis]QIS04329.1 nuclear transport factor 2 family protein [Nocardia brasiliensis]
MDTTTLPAPVRRALTAANSGDTNAFLATFTDHGTVDDWGREFRGHEAIRRWSDNEFIGKQITLEITSTTQTRDTVTVSAQVGGNGFNGPSDFTFTLNGDHLDLMRITG